MQSRPKAGPGPCGLYKSVEATGAKKIADSALFSSSSTPSDIMANKPTTSGVAAKAKKSGGKNLQTAGKVDKASISEMTETYIREVEDALAKITAMANLQGKTATDVGTIECVGTRKSDGVEPRQDVQEGTVERDQAVYEEHPAVRVVSQAVSKRSQDTVSACAAANGYNPLREGGSGKRRRFRRLMNRPQRSIRRACRRLFGKLGGWGHVKRQARNPYHNEGKTALRSSRNKDVDAWLDGTVEPTLKLGRVTLDQSSEGHFWDGEFEEEGTVDKLCPGCQQDPSGSAGRAECSNCYDYWKTITGDFIEHGDLERLCTFFDPTGETEPQWDPTRLENVFTSTENSITTFKGNGDRGKWGRFWRTLDMEVVARLGRWSRKVRIAAKCCTLTNVPSDHLYDETLECDYCPMFFLIKENFDVSSGNISISEILRDLAESFGVSESSGPETETDDNESVETFPDFSKIKVILPSGEIGYAVDPGNFGYGSRKKIAKDSGNSWEIVDSSDAEYERVAPEMAVKTYEAREETLKIETQTEFSTNHVDIAEEATEEIYTRELATDSFSRPGLVDTQLSEIFRQYRAGEFGENDSPLAAAEKFTNLVNEIFREACGETSNLIEPEREFASDTTTQTLLIEDAATSRVSLIGWTVESEEQEENEGSQLISFVSCEEDFVKRFFSRAMVTCAQDFMRELKLVTKISSPEGDTQEERTGYGLKNEVNDMVAPEDASEGKSAKTEDVVILPEEVQMEKAETAPTGEEKTVETTPSPKTPAEASDLTLPEIQTIKPNSESNMKAEEQIEVLVIQEPQIKKADEELQSIVIPVPWWKSLVNQLDKTENNVTTLWQSLALDESDGWQRIRVDFLRGNDLYLVSETRERVEFLRKMKKVIIEKANVEYAACGTASEKQSKLRFAKILEVFSPSEITKRSTKKGILKQPLLNSSDLFTPKRFNQALTGDQVKAMEEEMQKKFTDCTDFIIGLKGKFDFDGLESSLEVLRGCFKFSMENYLEEAKEQFLNYTHYMSGIRNRIISGLDLLYAAGEILAMLVDFLCDAETTESSIIEVEQRTAKLMEYLANSGTALDQIQNSLDVLRTEDFDYVKTMVELKLTGLSGSRDLSDTYKMLLKFHVEDRVDTKVVDEISGYEAFRKASDALEQATAYHSVSFFAIRLSRLQRGLDIVKDTRAELENHTKTITKRLRKVKRGMEKKAELEVEDDVKIKGNEEETNTQVS